MAQSQSLQFRQSQQLVLTPQMQQALKLLQCSTQDLQQYIEEEMEKNPLLMQEGDAVDGAAPSIEEREAAREEARAGAEEGGMASQAEADTVPSDARLEQVGEILDTSFENSWNQDDGSGGGREYSASGGGGNAEGEEYNFIEQHASSKQSLREHLLEQASIEFTSPDKRGIASALIDSLDAKGYLARDIQELAQNLGCQPQDVTEVLGRMQQFDPAGIFARNLSECLALQLFDRNHYDPAIKALLEHLDLVARGEVGKLARLCGVSEEDVRDMIQEVKTLNPHPGYEYEVEAAQEIVPDVLVTRRQNGNGWQVQLNSEALPRLIVNNDYKARIEKNARGETEKKFLKDNVNSANWLIKTLQQRADTILRVATEIVTEQEAFFEHGVNHLKPLILRDIAEKVEVHESTVGRVTSNKFMSTPRGVFEMRYFFSSGVQDTDGGEIASTSVKNMIKELIDGEGDSILSDERIAELLQEKGIDVARRTVAKYREAQHIPTSAHRKRQRKIRA